jgi:5-methylthioadenosine/S-adenosylhomocysteine deaminase
VTILIKNIRALSLRPSGEFSLDQRDILIEGDAIARVEPRITIQADRVIDGADKLAVPGLVNAHLHSSEAHLRGRYGSRPLEMWSLDVFPLRSRTIHRNPDPRFVYLRCMVAGIEALKNGATQILDDVIQRVNPTYELYEAAFRAYADLGIRAAVGASFVNRNFCDHFPYFEDILPAELSAEIRSAPPQIPVDDYLGLCDQLARNFNGAAGGRLQFVVAPSAPMRCTDELLTKTKEFARQRRLPYSIHALETQVQYVTGQQQYGESFIQYLDRLGALDDRTIIAHAIWIDDRDIEILAKRGCSVSHNAVTNLRMASGIAPWRKLRSAGVNLCLGTDSLSGNDSARLFDVIRVAGLIHCIADPNYESAPQAGELLWAATGGGAHALGMSDRAGTIAPGKKGDLVLFDLTTAPFTPLNDVCNQLVYAENGSSISHVIVGGEIVVEDGVCRKIDEKAILAEFRARCAEVLPEHIAAEEDSALFRPYMREVYRRCFGQTPLMGRFAASHGAGPGQGK